MDEGSGMAKPCIPAPSGSIAMAATDVTDAQRAFAADVMRGLLHRVAVENARGRLPVIVLFAWTQGPVIYLVYQAPPSEILWGLTCDTRTSLIDPGPWESERDAVLYYYEIALCEDRPVPSARHPGDPTTILWDNKIPELDLPERPSDIPAEYRHTPPTIDMSPTVECPPTPPRRYYAPEASTSAHDLVERPWN